MFSIKWICSWMRGIHLPTRVSFLKCIASLCHGPFHQSPLYSMKWCCLLLCPLSERTISIKWTSLSHFIVETDAHFIEDQSWGMNYPYGCQDRRSNRCARTVRPHAMLSIRQLPFVPWNAPENQPAPWWRPRSSARLTKLHRHHETNSMFFASHYRGEVFML